MLHDDDTFEADTAYESIRLGRRRADQRQDIEALGMTKQEVMGSQESAVGGRGAEMGWREVRCDTREGEAKVCQGGRR